ncbi:MAG: leucyl aminopeptidase [Sandaracinaceae bacterium]|nr:leucyl aminopeptidase [Sandaracinaceae bacterium]
MKVTLASEAAAASRVDLLAIAARKDTFKKDPTFRELDAATDGALSAQVKLEDFEGKPGQSLRIAVHGVGAKQILLVGVGEAEPSIDTVRSVAAKAGQAASSLKSVGVVVPNATAATVRAAASGVVLGAYRFTRYLTGDRVPKRQLSAARLVVAKVAPDLRRGAHEGETLGTVINAVRDLVNAPPNDLTPTALAQFAADESKTCGVDCKVWDKKGIEKLGMHLLLAVNRGSAEEPRFVHMVYKPKDVKAPRKIVFVGKGLTFDSGGLCIKPPKSMLDMKCDMAGAAVTIGVVLSAARLGLPIEVHGIIGSTENMTGASAYRPGDVFPSLDGKTVEIINTDAEGRLVLADALAYARNLDPDYLIDHATLTGACMVALGPWTAGLFTAQDELAQRYAAAAADEGESFWRLPLTEDLRETLRSDVADLKHTGDPYGGSISAALFLREFVGEAKWMHLDIAGPAFQERPHGIHPKGATGFGVLTAVRFLELLAG